jgi:hypothetical protein
MSSSKASVLATASQQGIVFDKYVMWNSPYRRNLIPNIFCLKYYYRLFEIRDVDDIDDLIKSELSTAESTGLIASSSAAVLSHSKPQRPGKGKAKVTKFKADE